MADPTVERTAIDGLLILRLPLHEDARGWFKENWQRAKMVPLGVPDFGPVQENMSHNVQAGVTRGFHAEPWDKFVSVASGRVFGAWVDLREGDGFGTLVTVDGQVDDEEPVDRRAGDGELGHHWPLAA